jgi:hypothetical protein
VHPATRNTNGHMESLSERQRQLLAMGRKKQNKKLSGGDIMVLHIAAGFL